MQLQGVPLDKVRALAYFSVAGIADVELEELEAHELGHIFIAMLCYLCVAEEGLREIELRELLANEQELVPKPLQKAGLTAKVVSQYGMFFFHVFLCRLVYYVNCTECAEPYYGQLSPLRFRLAFLRIRHHLIDIGTPGENRLTLAGRTCRRAVQKR
jgi:hypothetical protein